MLSLQELAYQKAVEYGIKPSDHLSMNICADFLPLEFFDNKFIIYNHNYHINNIIMTDYRHKVFDAFFIPTFADFIHNDDDDDMKYFTTHQNINGYYYYSFKNFSVDRLNNIVSMFEKPRCEHNIFECETMINKERVYTSVNGDYGRLVLMTLHYYLMNYNELYSNTLISAFFNCVMCGSSVRQNFISPSLITHLIF